MTVYSQLMFAPALALMAWAAVEDSISRRIPNWLTFSLALGGVATSVMGHGLVSPAMSAAGLAVGFFCPLLLFLLGALGGGDVKLLAGLGAWIGPVPLLVVFCIEAVIGAAMVLIQAMLQGRMRLLFRNSAVVAINLAHVKNVGLDHVKETGQSCRSVDRPLPFAVPMLFAVLILLALS